MTNEMQTEKLASLGELEDEFFIIEGGDVPWGDYGHILMHGMTAHLGRVGEQLQLERTGPFVPPITFPGVNDIVVTTQMRDAMISAGFRGIEFRPIIKARIVELDWQNWNQDAEAPKFYPEESEPEGYILDNPHSEQLSRQIGDLWEIVIADGVVMERFQTGEDLWDVDFRYKPGSRNDADLFSCPSNGFKYCSGRAKMWFEHHFPTCSRFRTITR